METLSELKKLLDESQSRQDIPGEVNARMKMGYLYKQQRKWPLAVRTYRDALEIVMGQKEVSTMACIQACMGTVFREQAQLHKAIDCFEQSLKNLVDIQEADAERAVKSILGISLWRRGDWDRSIELLIETRPLIKTTIPEAYHPLHEAIEKAVQQIENRIPAAQGNNNIMRVMQAHFTLVPLYLLLGQQEDAKRHLQKSESLANQINDANVLQAIPKLQSMLD